MQVPVLHSHSHDEATQEQHVSVLHVLDTHLEGGMKAPSGLYTSCAHNHPSPQRQMRSPDADFRDSLTWGWRVKWYVFMAKSIHNGLIWSPGVLGISERG